MTISALNALNLSVANAEKFVSDVKNNERILSFYLGGSSEETETNLNTDNRRSLAYRDASIVTRVPSSSVNVVTRKIPWVRSQVYNKWDSTNPPTSRYYVVYNNNVYLVLDNSDFNTTEKNGKIPVSVPPTHTSGVVKGKDGYAYLYLYTITATDKANVNSSEFMSVPDKVLTSHSGKLMSVNIDLSQIDSANLIIGEKDPIIPILSDTGSGASIQLETVVVSSPYATTSERLYKIIGIRGVNYGTVPYVDFELTDSLTAILTDESATQIADIAGAISLGFSSTNGLRLRDLLGCKYVAVNLELDSSSITGEVEQREFYNFGILENVKKTDDTNLFSGDETAGSFSNQLKLNIAALGTASPEGENLTFGTNLRLETQSGTTQKQNSKFVAKKQITPFLQEIEVHTTKLDTAEVGGKVNVPKSDEQYTIVAVTKPQIKQNSGNVLHIGATNFSFDSTVNKRFFAQVIQRF